MRENSIVEKWDEVYRRIPYEFIPWEAGKPPRDLVWLVENEIVKKGRVLDICCGAGTNSVYLANEGFQVVGIDVSTKAIDYAVARAEKANVKCDFIVACSFYLPFHHNVFGFVFDRGCFHHVPRKKRSLFVKEVHRVLKDHGNYHLICFSDKNPPGLNRFSKKQIVDYFSNHFDIKCIVETEYIEKSGTKRYLYSSFMEKI